jgi:hypothetical protein
MLGDEFGSDLRFRERHETSTLNEPFRFHNFAELVASGVDLSTIANIAAALTLLIGVAFGLIEMHRARREREERAAFAAVQALMTPEWMSSSMIVASIPDGTSAARDCRC